MTAAAGPAGRRRAGVGAGTPRGRPGRRGRGGGRPRDAGADPVRQLVHPPERGREITSVRLRLHLDGRTAAGSTTLTGADGLRDLVDRTVGGGPAVPGRPAVAGAGPARPGGRRRRRSTRPTAHATPAQRADRVRAFVDAAGGLETAGYCRTLSTRPSPSPTRPARPSRARTTEAAMDGIARSRRVDGVARRSAIRLAEIDGAVLGRPGGGQGAGRRRPGRTATRTVRGGAGTDRGRSTSCRPWPPSASTARRWTSAAPLWSSARPSSTRR